MAKTMTDKMGYLATASFNSLTIVDDRLRSMQMEKKHAHRDIPKARKHLKAALDILYPHIATVIDHG